MGVSWYYTANESQGVWNYWVWGLQAIGVVTWGFLSLGLMRFGWVEDSSFFHGGKPFRPAIIDSSNRYFAPIILQLSRKAKVPNLQSFLMREMMVWRSESLSIEVLTKATFDVQGLQTHVINVCIQNRKGRAQFI